MDIYAAASQHKDRNPHTFHRSGRCGGGREDVPAVKIVDLRHVSKEDVLLAAEDGRQQAGQSWVVHLSPVSLQ